MNPAREKKILAPANEQNVKQALSPEGSRAGTYALGGHELDEILDKYDHQSGIYRKKVKEWVPVSEANFTGGQMVEIKFALEEIVRLAVPPFIGISKSFIHWHDLYYPSGRPEFYDHKKTSLPHYGLDLVPRESDKNTPNIRLANFQNVFPGGIISSGSTGTIDHIIGLIYRGKILIALTLQYNHVSFLYKNKLYVDEKKHKTIGTLVAAKKSYVKGLHIHLSVHGLDSLSDELVKLYLNQKLYPKLMGHNSISGWKLKKIKYIDKPRGSVHGLFAY